PPAALPPGPFFWGARAAVVCTAQGRVRGDASRRRLTPEHHFKSAAEMRMLFADLPEACDNTLVIARRCAFMPEPRKPILPAFPCQSGRSEADELRAMAADGLERRLEAVVLRLEMSPA